MDSSLSPAALLKMAASRGDENKVRRLLTLAPRRAYAGAMEVAAKNDHLQVCKMIWEKYDTNDRPILFEPLVLAVEAGHLDIVKWWFKENNHVRPSDCPRSFRSSCGWGQTILEATYRGGHVELCEFLLKIGANPNECNEPSGRYGLLNHAVTTDRGRPFIRLFLKYGADDKDILRALWVSSIRCGDATLLALLFDCGGVTFFERNQQLGHRLYEASDQSTRVLTDITRLPSDRKKAITRLLVGRMSTSKPIKRFILTSIVELASRQDTETLRMILEEGVDISGIFEPILGCRICDIGGFSCRQCKGHDCLSAAFDLQKHESMKILLEFGANPFAKGREEFSCFEKGFLGNDWKTLKLCFDSWCLWFPRWGRNYDGDLPIHCICSHQHATLEQVDYVLQKDEAAVHMTDLEEELLPVHFAALWDLDLSIIYKMLRQSPALICKDSLDDATMAGKNTIVLPMKRKGYD